MKRSIQQKEQITEKNPTLENKEEVAKQVGVGAVVFHDLKNDRLNNFDFTLEEVVRFGRRDRSLRAILSCPCHEHS